MLWQSTQNKSFLLSLLKVEWFPLYFFGLVFNILCFITNRLQAFTLHLLSPANLNAQDAKFVDLFKATVRYDTPRACMQMYFV